jgi:hypothetical protein
MKLPRKNISQANPRGEAAVVAKPSPTARHQLDLRDGSPPFLETYVTVWIRRGTKEGYWEALMIDRNSKKKTHAIVTVRDVFVGGYKRRRGTKPEDLPF